MPKRPHEPRIPTGCTKHVRSAFLHAISRASTGLTVTWSRADKSSRPTTRLQGELDRANLETAPETGAWV